MRRVLFILICVLFIPGLPLFGGENILGNPGFEDGVLAPWEARGGAAEVVTDPQIEIDPGSYGIYAGHAYNRSAGWMGITQSVLDSVIEGETYTVGAYVRTDSADGFQVTLSYQFNNGGNDQYVNIASVDADNTEWVFVTGQFTVPSDLTSIYFYVEGPGSVYDDIYMDDAYVGIGAYERPGFVPLIRGAATNPDPASSEDPVVDPETTTEVSWAPSSDPNIVSVTGYDVVFGTDPNMLLNPVYPVDTNSLPLDGVDGPDPLDYDMTYHWRVDSHVVWDSNEITGAFTDTVEGLDWTFTTRPLLIVDAGSDVLTYLEILPAELTGSVDYRGEGVIESVVWEVLDTAVDAAKQMITRTDDLSSVTSDPNLLMDWIGTDTREVGNPLYLTLKGLPADTYDWTSYHHDAGDQQGTFDVTVYDTSGSTETTDIAISYGNTPPATTFDTTFTSNGVDNVILVFDLQDATVINQQFFVMNGFELTGTSGSLDIDFGTVVSATDANAVNVMNGYEAYKAQHEVAASFTEQSYSAFGTTVSILPTWGGGPATIEDTTNDPSSASQSADLDVDVPGEYTVQLSATDTENQASDTAIVTVAADACAAAQLSTDWDGFSDYDLDQDCDVDIDDLEIFVGEWLDDRNLTEQE